MLPATKNKYHIKANIPCYVQVELKNAICDWNLFSPTRLFSPTENEITHHLVQYSHVRKIGWGVYSYTIIITLLKYLCIVIVSFGQSHWPPKNCLFTDNTFPFLCYHHSISYVMPMFFCYDDCIRVVIGVYTIKTLFMEMLMAHWEEVCITACLL